MAAVYALVGIAWIIFSDALASGALSESATQIVQSVKGFLFVLVTAGVMYVLVGRLGDRLYEEARRSSAAERMLGQVVGTVPVGVLLTGDDGTITFLNAAAQRLLGVTEEVALGSSMGSLLGTQGGGAAALEELMRVGALDGVPVGGRGGAPARSAVVRAAAVDPRQPGTGWVFAIADVTEANTARAEAERLVGAYRFMVAAVDAASRAMDETELMRLLAEVAVASGRYRAAWSVCLDEDEGRYADVARIGMGERAQETAAMMRNASDHDPSRIPFEAGALMVSNDILRDPTNIWHSAALEEGFGSSVTFGVGTDGALVGGVTLFSDEIGTFDGSELEMLSGLLDSVNFQVSRIRSTRAQRASDDDPLRP